MNTKNILYFFGIATCLVGTPTYLMHANGCANGYCPVRK